MPTYRTRPVGQTQRRLLLTLIGLGLLIWGSLILYSSYLDNVRKDKPWNQISDDRIAICEPARFAYYPENANVLAIVNLNDLPKSYLSCHGDCCFQTFKAASGYRISPEIDLAIDAAASEGKSLYFRISPNPERTIAIYTK